MILPEGFTQETLEHIRGHWKHAGQQVLGRAFVMDGREVCTWWLGADATALAAQQYDEYAMGVPSRLFYDDERAPA